MWNPNRRLREALRRFLGVGNLDVQIAELRARIEALEKNQHTSLIPGISAIATEVAMTNQIRRWEMEALVQEIGRLRGPKATKEVIRRVTDWVQRAMDAHNASVRAAQAGNGETAAEPAPEKLDA